jgi:hypothetical protein
MTGQRTKVPMARSLPLRISDHDLYERVARRAYDLYQQRGEVPRDELADWLLAERLVQDELQHGPVPEEPLADEEAE